MIIHETTRYRFRECETLGGGGELERKADGASVYFQPGDDFDTALESFGFIPTDFRARTAFPCYLRDGHDNTFDTIAAEYDHVLQTQE